MNIILLRKFLIIFICTISIAHAREPAFINLNGGNFGVLDTDHQQRWGIEYRFASLTKYELIPTIGVVTGTHHAKYLYTEVRHNFYITPQWIITPSFGTGAFNNTNSLDLGNSVEFRSGLEFAYKFNNNYRAGIGVYHLSNAGISSTNPGTESVVLSISIPIGK